MGCGASKAAEAGGHAQTAPQAAKAPGSEGQAAASPSACAAAVEESSAVEESNGNGQDAGTCAIVVWSADGLRDADLIGTTDAYCVARVGPAGSGWDQKPRGSGRRSSTVWGSLDPKWSMGFTAHTSGVADPELHVRVFDKDFASEDDFLGEATASLASLARAGDPTRLELRGDRARGSVSVSAGRGVLDDSRVKPSALFQELAPIPGPQRKDWLTPVKVEDITGDGPFLLGKAPLPATMRGLFWLTKQGRLSALASFGGPNGDGGGCSIGDLSQTGRYSIRVSGDRVWANAEEYFYSPDVVYHFVFNDRTSPTKVQIYPEYPSLGLALGPNTEWLLDFEADLTEGDEEFPGSVVWRRTSTALGRSLPGGNYALVQVMDESGRRIEPAWSKFVAYQNSSAAGASPGTVYYHEIKG